MFQKLKKNFSFLNCFKSFFNCKVQDVSVILSKTINDVSAILPKTINQEEGLNTSAEASGLDKTWSFSDFPVITITRADGSVY